LSKAKPFQAAGDLANIQSACSFAVRRLCLSRSLPYGTKDNLPTMESLMDTAFKQKLTPYRMTTSEVFVNLG
jgi:4,5-dihydroxyphthalate decarboxylase